MYIYIYLYVYIYVYIYSSRSNHPPAILKHLPESINKRISQLSSDQDAFDSSAHLYQDALRRSNYQHKLSYQSKNNPKMPKRKRSRNITWFNPPFSQNVQSKIGREFLRLLDTHFPKSSPLSKIFFFNFFILASPQGQGHHNSVSQLLWARIT